MMICVNSYELVDHSLKAPENRQIVKYGRESCGVGTKNHYAGEDQQQFSSQSIPIRTVCQARNSKKQGFALLPASCWFLLGLFFDPEYGGDVFLRNVC
jgi:hypothetical protein